MWTKVWATSSTSHSARCGRRGGGRKCGLPIQLHNQPGVEGEKLWGIAVQEGMAVLSARSALYAEPPVRTATCMFCAPSASPRSQPSHTNLPNPPSKYLAPSPPQVPNDQPWWFRGAQWADVSVEHLRKVKYEAMYTFHTFAQGCVPRPQPPFVNHSSLPPSLPPSCRPPIRSCGTCMRTVRRRRSRAGQQDG